MKHLLFFLFLCVSFAHAENNLTALDDGEMSGINGQQGALINLNFRNNVTTSNAPIGCTVAVGSPNPCRFGLEFAARAGKWVMLKEYYGTLQIKNLRMEAGFLPSTATAYANTDRFKDGSGTCLLVGAPGCSPKGLPTVLMSYPDTDAPAVYDDMLSLLNIGRVWIESDTAIEPAGIRGFDRDTTLSSMMGVRMSDSSALNASARMRFRGTAYVFGF